MWVNGMNLTMSISGGLEQIVKENRHIKWTEIARSAIKEEAIKMKKMELLAKYLDKKTISGEEWRLMEKIDWHPADEIEFKDGFVQDVIKASKGKTQNGQIGKNRAPRQRLQTVRRKHSEKTMNNGMQ